MVAMRQPRLREDRSVNLSTQRVVRHELERSDLGQASAYRCSCGAWGYVELDSGRSATDLVAAWREHADRFPGSNGQGSSRSKNDGG